MRRIFNFVRELQEYYALKRRYKRLIKKYYLNSLNQTMSDHFIKDKMKIEMKRLERILLYKYEDYKTVIG